MNSHDVSPSSENFDRNAISEHEFTERLLFENRELKEDIRRQNETIRIMNMNTANTTNLLYQQLEEKDKLITRLQDLLKNKDEMEIQEPKVEKTQRKDSTSVGTVTEIGTSGSAATLVAVNSVPTLVPPTPSLSSALEASAANPKTPQMSTPIVPNHTPTIITPDIPLRSTRRRREEEDNKAREIGRNTSESNHPYTPRMEEVSGESRSINNSYTETTPRAEQTPKLEQTPRFESTPRMSNFTAPIVSNPALNNSTERLRLDAILEKLHRKISSSTVLATPATKEDGEESLYSVDSKTSESYDENNLSKSLMNANKNGTSNSSIRSYKSRIKLPPTMQKQQENNDYPNDLSKDYSKTSILEDYEDSDDKEDIDVNRAKESLRLETLKHEDSRFTPFSSTLSLAPSSIHDHDYNVPRTPDAFKHSDDNKSALFSPASNAPSSPYRVLSTSNNSGHQKSTGSFNVLPSPKIEEDTPLFIQPEDFHTIYLHIVSTIHVVSASQSHRSNDPNSTISIHDRETDKEMWKIRKSYSQMLAFDNEIRPIVEYFGLPVIPDKSMFLSTSPSKVDHRRVVLQNYFNSLALLPHIPQLVLLRICRFISLDVVNPLDDFKSGARKEGFLLRRYKSLGSSWKVRWCQVEGPYLEVYENPGGQLLEQIKLKGAQIGRQNTDSVAEDKGYRHAFLIMEERKNTKLSSSAAKHFFCAETDEERDDWLNLLLEFNSKNDSTSTIDAESISSQTQIDTHDTASNVTTNSRNNGSSISIPLNDNVYRNRRGSLNSQGISSHNGRRDSLVTNLEEDKEPTKRTTKKKSFLSFINKNTTEDDATIPADVSTERSDTSMQQYLDQMKLDEEVADAIFGRELLISYNLSNKKFNGRLVPSLIYRCLDFFSKTGAIYEEGLFRLSGSASAIRNLKDTFSEEYDLDFFQSPLKPDVHTVSGLFKTYLRELPSPIIGRDTYQYLNGVMLNNNSNQISQSSNAILFRDYFNNPKYVDEIHYNTSYVIFQFLRIIIKNNQINRMNLRNVCIVFVPTLNISLEVLSVFLVDFDCIFENQPPIPDNQREILDIKIPNF